MEILVFTGKLGVFIPVFNGKIPYFPLKPILKCDLK